MACSPVFLKGQVKSPGNTGNLMKLGVADRGSNGQGLTGFLFAFSLLWLSPPGWVQCSVWKGLLRIGQVSLCGHPFSLSPAGFRCFSMLRCSVLSQTPLTKVLWPLMR